MAAQPFSAATIACPFHPEQHTAIQLCGGGCSAVVLPWYGATLTSFVSRGREWLDQTAGVDGPGTRLGAPLLFPTPNRVSGGVYTYNGRTICQQVDGKARILHGLVYDAPFEVVETGADEQAAWVTLCWTHTPQSPRFSAFPFACRLTVTWTLQQDGIALDYRVDNDGDAPLPFGFAWHPYLAKTDPEATVLTVEADEVYEAIACFPTGRVYSLDDRPEIDLRKGKALADLMLDDVFRGITPDSRVEADCRDLGLKLRFFQTADFTHVVVFTPHHLPFYCIENQTCSTDAANLAARGAEGCGLKQIDAGSFAAGRCGFVVADR